MIRVLAEGPRRSRRTFQTIMRSFEVSAASKREKLFREIKLHVLSPKRKGCESLEGLEGLY
jgi:hypothetical protein